MNYTKIKLFKSPYSVSVIVHSLILILFALIIVPQSSIRKWIEIDLIDNIESTDLIPVEKATKGEKSVPSTDSDRLTNNEGHTTSISSTKSMPERSKSPQDRTIDIPVINSSESHEPASAPATIPGKRGKVSGPARPSGTSNEGNGYSFDGDGIAINSMVKPDLKVSDYGEVKLEFSVNQDMTVNLESIRVIKSGTSAQNESSLRALRKWTFKALGIYNPSKKYTILFRFNPS